MKIVRNLSVGKLMSFNTRGKVLAISSLNIRTLVDVASQMIHISSKYRINTACLSEIFLILVTSTGYTTVAFRITQSVAIAMFDHSALIEWKPINDRMAYARFKSISIISTYAPSLSTYDHNKDKELLCGTSTANKVST